MKLLMKKEWKLVVTPVPLLFLLLSALVLVPSYPYYVTFFYNALGIFLMLQAARENRDVYYMALLPVTKRDVVRARFSTVVTLQLLQIAACIPFMLLRRSYAQINNPVGIEANLAFLGFGFVLMGLFNLTFLSDNISFIFNFNFYLFHNSRRKRFSFLINRSQCRISQLRSADQFCQSSCRFQSRAATFFQKMLDLYWHLLKYFSVSEFPDR